MIEINAATRLKVMAAPTMNLAHARKVLAKVGIKVGKPQVDTVHNAVWLIKEDQYNDFTEKLEAAYGAGKKSRGTTRDSYAWNVPQTSTLLVLSRAKPDRSSGFKPDPAKMFELEVSY